jgi:hypothetical protein
MVGNEMKKRRSDVLIDFIKTKKMKRIAEIGVWKSGLCKSILKSECKNILDEYWAIDSWRPEEQGWKKYREIPLSDWESLHKYACGLMLYFPQLKIIRTDSKIATSIFGKEYFDLVFIDADHSYDAVKQDIDLWFPLVKKKGLLTGHDYGSRRHQGVKFAVDEIFRDKVQVFDDLVWCVEIS